MTGRAAAGAVSSVLLLVTIWGCSESGTASSETAAAPGAAGASEAATGGAAGHGGAGVAGGRGGTAGIGSDFAIPLTVEERSGVGSEGLPVVVGLPLAEGALADAVPMEFAGEPVDTGVTARWPDGSVRWLRAEFSSPPLTPGQVMTGRLEPRHAETTIEGSFQAGTSPAAVSSASLTLEASSGDSQLFSLSGPGVGALSGTIGVGIESSTDPRFKIASYQAGTAMLERDGDLSATLVRRDHLQNQDGLAVVRLITRGTLFREQPLIKIQHTFEVLRGNHAIKRWDLSLPVGEETEFQLALSAAANGTEEKLTVPFAVRQVTPNLTVTGSAEAKERRLPGGIAFGDAVVVAAPFWEHAPIGYRAEGGTLVIELVADHGGQAPFNVVFDEGSSFTQTVWLRAGGAGPQGEGGSGEEGAHSVGAWSALLSQPVHARLAAEDYQRAAVWGALGLPVDGDHAAQEELLVQASVNIFKGRASHPEHLYGRQRFGDFFDPDGNLTYSGALNQEYDPGIVLLQQALRAGDGDALDRALELAWHYVDADIAYYGGCSQHRSTRGHIDRWIDGLLSASFRQAIEAHLGAAGVDASLVNVVDAVDEQPWGSGQLEINLRTWIEAERAHITDDDELIRRAYLMMAQDAVEGWRNSVPPVSGPLQDETFVRYYARGILSAAYLAGLEPILRRSAWTDPQLGGTGYNPDADFAEFFALYGGSWAQFPSFHGDTNPLPLMRHSGSHSIIESVVLAALLTDEPRLREMVLGFARHHVDVIVPAEIAKLKEAIDAPEGDINARRIGWPLINLTALTRLTAGVPELSTLHTEVATAMAEVVAVIVDYNGGVTGPKLNGSIHAGILMQALARYHQLTGDVAAGGRLVDIARFWAANAFDATEAAFCYKNPTISSCDGAAYGFTGLVLSGLVYGQALDPDEATGQVLLAAWDALGSAGRTDNAKVYSMLLRGMVESMDDLHLFQQGAP